MIIFRSLVAIMKNKFIMSIARRCRQPSGIFDYSGMLLY